MLVEDWAMAMEMATSLTLLQNSPKSIAHIEEINFVLSRIFLFQNTSKSAINMASKSAFKYPAQTNVWIALADLLCRVGKQKTGLRLLNSTYYSGSDSQKSSLILGASKMQNESNSKKHFAKAVFMIPNSSEGWVGLSSSISNPKIAEKALMNAECVNKSTTFGPWISIFYCFKKLQLIENVEECGQYIEILDNIATETVSSRQKQAALIVLNQYLLLVGDAENAAKSLKQAIGSSGGSPDFGLYIDLARLYVDNGNIEAAVACMEKQVEISQNCTSLLNLAFVLIRTKDYEKASNIAQKALLKEPNSISAMYLKALCDKKRLKPMKHLERLQNSALPKSLLALIEA